MMQNTTVNDNWWAWTLNWGRNLNFTYPCTKKSLKTNKIVRKYVFKEGAFIGVNTVYETCTVDEMLLSIFVAWLSVYLCCICYFKDINECEESANVCEIYQECINYDGHYYCHSWCGQGYKVLLDPEGGSPTCQGL